MTTPRRGGDVKSAVPYATPALAIVSRQSPSQTNLNAQSSADDGLRPCAEIACTS